jgi:hypothetical protein
MSDTENIEEVITYIKPSNILLSDVSYELKDYCQSNGLPILDNIQRNHLNSLHNFLKSHFSKKKKIFIYKDNDDYINEKED